MRTKKIYFQEDQRQSKFVWVIMLIINLIFIIGSIRQLVTGEYFGDEPISDAGLIIVTVIVLLFSVSLTIFCKLRTIINSEGVFIRYFPFQLRYKFIDWNTVDKLSVIRYKPILEYGGWGVRKKRKGIVAYTMKGRMGLRIDLKNGKSVLIGTQSPEYLKDILTKSVENGVKIG